ncbi:MAG: nuclear transport factor 2 family protein [Mycobacteriales bacterium]
MSSAGTGSRADLVRRGYAAFQSGDMDAMRTILAADVVWHAPGQGPQSGDFEGLENVIGEFGRLFQDSGGTFRVEITEILEGDESVVVLARSSGSREGRTLAQPYAHIFHFRGDQVSEAWVVNYNQAESDAFWS